MKRIREILFSIKEDCNIFDESVTRIYIEDEAAGEFICISQCHDEEQTLKFDHEEIEPFIEALREMAGHIDRGEPHGS